MTQTYKSANIIDSVEVHWYGVYKHGDAIEGKYYPMYKPQKIGKTTKNIPWKDKISTDSVLLKFDKFTKSAKLTADVKKKLYAERN